MTTKNQNHKPAADAPSALTEAIDDLLDAIDDESQTPREVAKRNVRAMVEMKYPNEQRRAAAIDQLRQFERKIPEIKRGGDDRILARETAATLRACVELARPLPEVTRASEADKWGQVFVQRGWNGTESDGAIALLQSGEAIVAINVRSVTTDRRVIDRVKVRESCCPSAWGFGIDKWLAERFPRIPTPQEEAEANEN